MDQINQDHISFKNRDIISITDFSREEILFMCKQAEWMFDLEKSGQRYKLVTELKTRVLASLFFEPSTRTKTSFEIAMRELGGGVFGFAGPEGTSLMKKESILATLVMEESYHSDAIIMRHPLDGSVQWAADVSAIPVINGGDGKNEHPTQSLLDIFTLYQLNDKTLDGISIGFGGDLAHGRTVRSLSLALSHFKNITIIWSAEDFLGMPDDLKDVLESRGVKVIREKSVEDVMKGVQVYYMTRPQLERMDGVTKEDILKMMEKYRIDIFKVEKFSGKVLHPLPVNSEIAEIDYKVFFHKSQGFFQQAENGLFLRKALLYNMFKGHGSYIPFQGELRPELCVGNNKLIRAGSAKSKPEMFVGKITFGIVLDHLAPDTSKSIASVLNLTPRELDFVKANLHSSGKSFLKIPGLGEFTERELKMIAQVSSEPTVNYIRGGNIYSKFNYLLCRNSNCITNAVNEDVPPKFYLDDGTIRCRYCRRPYNVSNPKVTELELNRFKQSLPRGVIPVRYQDFAQSTLN